MPDFIDNHVFVTGPVEDLAFRQTHFVRRERTNSLEFDFETIIPMPEILDGTQSDTETDLALIALGVDLHIPAVAWPPAFEQFLEFDWVKAANIRSRQDLVHYLQKHDPSVLAAAAKRIEAATVTGHHDRHAWRIANWGAKWGPSSTVILSDKPELLEFRFETPWSFPEPVFHRLGRLYPRLNFDIAATNSDLDVDLLSSVCGGEIVVRRAEVAGNED
jgi:hypothetical protein